MLKSPLNKRRKNHGCNYTVVPNLKIDDETVVLDEQHGDESDDDNLVPIEWERSEIFSE